jgi:phosphoribosylformimino-5-aminoimidazole carboxamide ribotide isomerase
LDAAENLISNIDIPVIYSGGITSAEDIRKLKQINTDYVVIGSALYKGLIEFEDLLEYQD